MKAIVVVDNKWGIGKHGGLLFRLPADMQFFRRTTLGATIVVGANTYRSFPHGALPDRTNIVLDDSGASYPDALCASDLQQLWQILRQTSGEVYVAGGASVYKQLLPQCSEALVTKVDADGGADVFFTDLDEQPDWRLAEQSAPLSDNGYTIRFCRYVNVGLASNEGHMQKK